MTEEEFWWEYYMHPSRPYDGRVIQQVKGRAECEMKKYKWKEPKMTNAEWMQKNGIKFKSLRVERENGNVYTVVLEGRGRVNGGTWVCADNKIKAILQWLDKEYKAPVLDESEREYLAAIIKPFKNRVMYIIKNHCADGFDRLEIKVNIAQNEYDNVLLPGFKDGKMYKGMDYRNAYTPGELGL